MSDLPLLRIVVDTNVVFEGLTKQGGASGLIIDAWLVGQALSSEIDSVLATREQTEPEAELSLDIVARLQERIQKRS
ncbi:hypothetical protein [Synechocystis sp. PCC 7509]|uniref:hypothetical protein n=1 Tax=Synechocystis sp. PCC 7509 TaxID=927677 RepID=UPI0002ACED27|nr:hypothetical protein [Synechocystis sp. PCC 7509]